MCFFFHDPNINDGFCPVQLRKLEIQGGNLNDCCWLYIHACCSCHTGSALVGKTAGRTECGCAPFNNVMQLRGHCQVLEWTNQPLNHVILFSVLLVLLRFPSQIRRLALEFVCFVAFVLEEELTWWKVFLYFHHCRCCWYAVCFSCRASLWSLPINVKSFRVPCSSLSDHKLRPKASPSICLLRQSLPSLSSYGNYRAKSSSPLLCRSIRPSQEM